MSKIFQKNVFQVGVSLETLAAAMSQMARIGEMGKTGWGLTISCSQCTVCHLSNG